MANDSVYTGTQGPQGDTGATGPQGPQGPAGNDGQGVPTGGSTGQYLEKQSGTDFDTAWATPKYRCHIWAEEASSLGNNSREWSFGNGATGNIGLPALANGRIIAIGCQHEVAGGGTTEIEVEINFASVGVSVTTAPNIASGVNDAFTPVAFSKGDILSFRTITAGSASDSRVTILIEYDG